MYMIIIDKSKVLYTFYVLSTSLLSFFYFLESSPILFVYSYIFYCFQKDDMNDNALLLCVVLVLLIMPLFRLTLLLGRLIMLLLRCLFSPITLCSCARRLQKFTMTLEHVFVPIIAAALFRWLLFLLLYEAATSWDIVNPV